MGSQTVALIQKIVCRTGKAKGWRKRAGKGKRLRKKAKKYGGPG